MIDEIFFQLDAITDLIWSYPALFAILTLGVWLSIKSRFFQIRKLPFIIGYFFKLIRAEHDPVRGIHPLRAFFASIGGAIGMGNVVVVCAAIQIGGPGAIFWLWITAILGSLLKYAEIYVGILHRIRNTQGSYDGGPMFYLQKAFRVRWIPIVVSLLLCIYGAEVFMFSEMTSIISSNWQINRIAVTAILLVLVFYACLGGVRRVGLISSIMIPIFVLFYLLMSLWVFMVNIDQLPSMITTIFQSAFTGHAAIGGFAGSTLLLAMSQGAARGSYSSDIGIGYSSVIDSETSLLQPAQQACLAIFGVFLDTAICTASVFLILLTGVWSTDLPVGMMVQTALSQYFPYMHLFMPFFLFLLGYSTIIAYFVVGLKSAAFLLPRIGRRLYSAYFITILALFSFVDPYNGLVLMTLCGGLLLLFNLTGIWLLRKEIRFAIE